MTLCEFGDVTCPCQDGDACHYTGDAPLELPTRYRQVVNFIRESCPHVAHLSAHEIARALFSVGWIK